MNKIQFELQVTVFSSKYHSMIKILNFRIKFIYYQYDERNLPRNVALNLTFRNIKYNRWIYKQDLLHLHLHLHVLMKDIKADIIHKGIWSLFYLLSLLNCYLSSISVERATSVVFSSRLFEKRKETTINGK